MINKRKRDELLTSFFKENQEILINAIDIQKELQHKDTMERALVDVTRQVLILKEKLEHARGEIFALKCHAPYYERFEVRA
jgi:hypothetical protein